VCVCGWVCIFISVTYTSTFSFLLFIPHTEDMSGTDVWIERSLGFDEWDLDNGNDDELSFGGAPSYCANISF